MKTTAVIESLSYYKTNVLFQRILQDFKKLKKLKREIQKENEKSILVQYRVNYNTNGKQ